MRRGILISLILACFIITTASATTFYVSDPNGNDSWDGLAPIWDGTHGPKATIQAGIDVSQTADTVILAAGTYSGSRNRDLDFNGKAIILKSVNPNNSSVVSSTIINCTGSGRGFYFHNDEDPNSTIAGLTITNGNAGYADYGEGKGGAIYCEQSSPTITRCNINGNSANGEYENSGGGIYCEGGSPVITSCTISNNTAQSDEYMANDACGGGIYCIGGSPVISDCTIIANSAVGIANYDGMIISSGLGGGLYFNYSTPIVSGCTIKENSAIGGDAPSYSQYDDNGGPGGDGLGGGVYWGSNCTVNLIDCLIQDNETQGGNGGSGKMGETGGNGGNGGNACGSGIYIKNDSGGISKSIKRCRIIGNTAQAGNGGDGGESMGMYLPSGDGGDGGNSCGGAIACDQVNSNIIIQNCVISDNVISGGSGGSEGIYNPEYGSPGADGMDGQTNGGGLYILNEALITVKNCTFTNNAANCANGKGGGIYSGGATTLPTEIANCIFKDNSKQAIYDDYSSSMFSDISYCVFYNNPDGDYSTAIDPGIVYPGDMWSYCSVIDPLFVGDYHLKSFSPCINAGDLSGSYGGQQDIDNEMRIRYGRIDIGADEVFSIAGDVEPDEDIDISDLAAFTSEWLNSCSQPGWCNNCDINQSTTVDIVDFSYFACHWLYGVEE